MNSWARSFERIGPEEHLLVELHRRSLAPYYLFFECGRNRLSGRVSVLGQVQVYVEHGRVTLFQNKGFITLIILTIPCPCQIYNLS